MADELVVGRGGRGAWEGEETWGARMSQKKGGGGSIVDPRLFGPGLLQRACSATQRKLSPRVSTDSRR